MMFYEDYWAYNPGSGDGWLQALFLICGAIATFFVLRWTDKRFPKLPQPRPRSHADYTFSSLYEWSQLYDFAPTPATKELAARSVLGGVVYDAAVREGVQRWNSIAADEQAPQEIDTFAPEPDEAQTSTAEPMVHLGQDRPKAIFFKDGEPTSLDEYSGQEHVVSYLKAVVNALPSTEVVPREHQLFLGPAGLGKTLLAKCFANSLEQRNAKLRNESVWFQEEFPADLPDLKSLDRAIRKASQRPTVLFIDEIHDLKTEGHALKLYLLMEEGRYKFEGEAFPVELPNVCVVGATTDYGALHPALKRRFNRHSLQPLNKEQITAIVEGRSFPITPSATSAIVERTYFSGAPWEALQLYRQAMQFARARRSSAVEMDDVSKVFESQQIDALGLGHLDRQVIRVLLGQPRYKNNKALPGGREFVCFAASENDTCTMAQVDKGEYRESIKPRLMSRGLLGVRPTYGQALQPRAVELYSWLSASAN